MAEEKNTSGMTIGVGKYSIGLNESIMQRLQLLSECGYMIEQLDMVVGAIVDIFQESDFEGQFLSAEQSMKIISLINDVKKDYKFLTTLDVKTNEV